MSLEVCSTNNIKLFVFSVKIRRTLIPLLKDIFLIQKSNLINRYNDLVKRSNEQLTQTSVKSLTDQMNSKDEKLKAIIVDIHNKINSFPIDNVRPASKSPNRKN